MTQTDQTTELQALLDAAGAGGEVTLPAGHYYCHGLRLPPHLTLRGCGAWSSDGTGGTVLHDNGQGGATLCFDHTTGCAVNGLTLVCDSGAGQTDAIHAAGGAASLRFEDVLICGFPGCGFSLTGNDISLRHCTARGCGQDGFALAGQDLVLLDSTAAENGDNGVSVRGGSFVSILSCRFDKNGACGVLAAASDGVLCNGCDCSENGKNAISADDVTGLSVSGCVLQTATTDAQLAFERVRGLIVSGCILSAGGEEKPPYAITVRALTDAALCDTVFRNAYRTAPLLDGGLHSGQIVFNDCRTGGDSQ